MTEETELRLGIHKQEGDCTFQLVKAGQDLYAGDCCKHGGDKGDFVVRACKLSDPEFKGIVCNSHVPEGSYFWLIVKGMVTAKMLDTDRSLLERCWALPEASK